MSLPLSIVVPVKNDVQNLRLCLERLKGREHVLVVGSGDLDSSEAVAKEFAVDYQAFHWDGKFPKKRNWVLRNFTFETEWVLFLDADEFPTKAFWTELEATLPDTGCAGFWLRYDNYFMDKLLRHGDPCPKLALFRVGAGEYERIDEDSWSHLDMEVHEHPVIEGTIGEIKAPIEHHDFRGMEHWVAKHNAYSDWEARRYLRLITEGEAEWNKLTPRQRTKYRNLVKWWFPSAYFFGAYVLKKGFLDGVAGLRVALLKSGYFFLIQLKIADLKKKAATAK